MTMIPEKEAEVSLQYQLIKLAWNGYQAPLDKLDKSVWPQLERQAQMAKQLIEMVLSSPEADEYSVSEAEVSFVQEHLEQQFEEEGEFAACLNQHGLSLEQLQVAIWQDLLCEKVMEGQCSDVELATEEEALIFYEQNAEQFERPEVRKVSHILITINDEYKENRRKAAKAKITALRDKLLVDISRFSELAEANSECPTALNDGFIGEVKKGQLYPEIDACLFKMAPDSLSKVVETEVGFHLLYCQEVTEARRLPIDEVLPTILEQMNSHRKKVKQKQWLSTLVKTSAVA